MGDPATPLQTLMKKHGLLQIPLSAEVGISQPTLSGIARGTQRPSLHTALRLVSILSRLTGEAVTVESLFGSLVDEQRKAS